jgi:hypothetical protein
MGAMQPKDVPIHLSQIDTSGGAWLFDVQSVAQTQDGKAFLLKVVLEQRVDEESRLTRELELIMPASFLKDPELSADLIDRIRIWIENPQNEDYLNLT